MSEYDSYLGRDSDRGGRTSPFGVPPPSVRLMGDVAECQWVEERVRPWGKGNTGGVQLGHIMPEGLAGYARVLHPAESRDDESPLRWAEVAARTGKTAHPLMQFGRLGGFDDYYGCPDWAYAPLIGRLPEHETLVLSGILRDFTTSPERCYFGFWYGYAFLGSGYERVPRGFPCPIVTTWCSPASWMPFWTWRTMGATGRRRTCGGPTTGRGSSPPTSTCWIPMSAAARPAYNAFSKVPSWRRSRHPLMPATSERTPSISQKVTVR